MALIEFSPLVSEIRGSVANITFSYCRTGNFSRIKKFPKSSRTQTQATYRNYFSAAMARWLDVLTNAQRVGWNDLGAATTYTNSAGQEYNPSGLNLFIGCNCWLQTAGETMITTDPATARWAAPDFDEPPTIGSSWLEFAVTPPWPPDVTGYCLCQESPPVSQATYYYSGPWLKQATEDIEIIRFDQIFAPGNMQTHIVGKRYFYRFTAMQTDGMLSQELIIYGDVAA